MQTKAFAYLLNNRVLSRARECFREDSIKTRRACKNLLNSAKQSQFWAR